MRLLQTLLMVTACGLASNLALADDWKNEPGKGRQHDDGHHESGWHNKNYDKKKSGKRGHESHGGSYFHQHGYSRLDIPKGHYPPPGMCRVWYPGRPPGQQPPPAACGVPVPPGAWLIRHPMGAANHVHVSAYDPHRPGVVQAIGEFDIGSGMFVRIIVGQ